MDPPLSDRLVGGLDAPPLPLHLQQVVSSNSSNSMFPRQDSETSIASSNASTAPNTPRSRSSSFTRSKKFLTGEGLSAHEQLGILDEDFYHSHANALSFSAARNMLRDALYSSPTSKPPPPPPQNSHIPPLVLHSPPIPPPLPPSNWSPGPRTPQFLSPRWNALKQSSPLPMHLNSSNSLSNSNRHFSPSSNTNRTKSLSIFKGFLNNNQDLSSTNNRFDKQSRSPVGARTWHSEINRAKDTESNDSKSSTSAGSGITAKIARFSGTYIDPPSKNFDSRDAPLSPTSPSIADKIRKFDKDFVKNKKSSFENDQGDQENRNLNGIDKIQQSNNKMNAKEIIKKQSREQRQFAFEDGFKIDDPPIRNSTDTELTGYDANKAKNDQQKSEQINFNTDMATKNDEFSNHRKIASVPVSSDTMVSQIDYRNHVQNKTIPRNASSNYPDDDSLLSGNMEKTPSAQIADEDKPFTRLLQPETLKQAIPSNAVESVTTSSSATSKKESEVEQHHKTTDDTKTPDTTEHVHSYQQIQIPHLALAGMVNARSFINGPSPDALLGQAARERCYVRPDSHEAYVKAVTEEENNVNQSNRTTDMNESQSQKDVERDTAPIDSHRNIVVPYIHETNVPPAAPLMAEENPNLVVEHSSGQQGIDLKRRVSGFQKRLKDAGAGIVNKAKQLPRGASFTRVKQSTKKTETTTVHDKKEKTFENDADSKKDSTQFDDTSTATTSSVAKPEPPLRSSPRQNNDENLNKKVPVDREVNPLQGPSPSERRPTSPIRVSPANSPVLSSQRSGTDTDEPCSPKSPRSPRSPDSKPTTPGKKETRRKSNTSSSKVMRRSNLGAHSDTEGLPEFVTVRRKIRRIRDDGTEEIVTKKVRLRPERILPNGDVIVKRTMRVAKEDGSGGTQMLTVMQVIPRRKRSSLNAKSKAMASETRNERGAMTDTEDVQVHVDVTEATSMPDMPSVRKFRTERSTSTANENQENMTITKQTKVCKVVENDGNESPVSERSVSMPEQRSSGNDKSLLPTKSNGEVDGSVVSRSRSACVMGDEKRSILNEHGPQATVMMNHKMRRASDVVGINMKREEGHFYNWARAVTRRFPRGKSNSNVARNTEETNAQTSPPANNRGQRPVSPISDVDEEGRRRVWRRKNSLPNVLPFHNRRKLEEIHVNGTGGAASDSSTQARREGADKWWRSAFSNK